MDEIKKNEAILGRLYWMKEDLGRMFTISDLERLGFNFGVSSEGKLIILVGFGKYLGHTDTRLILNRKLSVYGRNLKAGDT